mgnify:CR=1 FL=1
MTIELADLKTFLGFFILALLTALAPIQGALVSAALLVTGDFITGVWAAKTKGEAITSARIRDTFSKMFLYLLGITLAYSIEAGMGIGLFPWVKSICLMIALSEFKSILENTNRILGRPVFKEFLKKIGSKNRFK